MSTFESREAILAEACRIAHEQAGGTLATMHAEDGTPYVTYVLFHLRESGEVLFGSGASTQHSRNMAATPEVSFLIDNRDIVATDWKHFDRVVIEGRAELIDGDHADYSPFLAELGTKSAMAATFTKQGNLYCIRPRRLILRKGIEATKYLAEFV